MNMVTFDIVYDNIRLISYKRASIIISLVETLVKQVSTMDRIAVILMCVLAVNAEGIMESDLPDNNIDSTANEAVNPENSNINFTLSTLATSPFRNIEDELYNDVLNKDFDTAVRRASLLYDEGYNSIIKNAVNRLLADGKSEAIDFAYKLMLAKGRFVIRDCFPEPLRIVDFSIHAKLVSRRDNCALRIGVWRDSDGDRLVYCDPKTEKVGSAIVWKFLPRWVDNRVYFQIKSFNLPHLLKLSLYEDSDGDYGAYADIKKELSRNLWYLEPVNEDGKILYYIINKAHNAVLKLGRSINSDGYRIAYGYPGLYYITPQKYGWDIRVV